MDVLVLCCAVLSCSVVSDSVTTWTVAHQAPLSMGNLQARILEWVAMPFYRESSQPRSSALQMDSLLLSHWEAHMLLTPHSKPGVDTEEGEPDFFLQITGPFLFSADEN